MFIIEIEEDKLSFDNKNDINKYLQSLYTKNYFKGEILLKLKHLFSFILVFSFVFFNIPICNASKINQETLCLEKNIKGDILYVFTTVETTGERSDKMITDVIDTWVETPDNVEYYLSSNKNYQLSGYYPTNRVGFDVSGIIERKTPKTITYDFKKIFKPKIPMNKPMLALSSCTFDTFNEYFDIKYNSYLTFDVTSNYYTRNFYKFTATFTINEFTTPNENNTILYKTKKNI